MIDFGNYKLILLVLKYFGFVLFFEKGSVRCLEIYIYRLCCYIWVWFDKGICC